MAHTRRRAHLTESWDDVAEPHDSHEDAVWGDDEERDEMGSAYRSGARATRKTHGENAPPLADSTNLPRWTSSGCSGEPEPAPQLVTPDSPDGGAQAATSRRRDATPRLRLNERSNTSDAGRIRKTTRAATPRSRAMERSMTSDAGRATGSRLKQHDEAQHEPPDEPQDEPQGESVTARCASVLWQRLLRPLLAYAASVAGHALHTAKPVLGLLLSIYCLGAALVFFSGFLTNSVNNALSPVCRLPFTGGLPFCLDRQPPEIPSTADFGQLVKTQDVFQDVLANAAGSVNLPLDMKRGEAGIRDLKHVVEYSRLESRESLVFEFDAFIQLARGASQKLTQFNSRIGRAVDHVLSTNRWTLNVIGGVERKEGAPGAIAKFVTNTLNIFAPFQPIRVPREIVLEQYLRHGDAIHEQILSLIDEALVLQRLLNEMDNRLDVIQGIAARDDARIDVEKDELLAALWTRLGGNRHALSKLNGQLHLLRNVGAYRRLAWGHVSSTLLKLQEIQATLEDLRERVAIPALVGTDHVPLEVHIANIQLGIERLEKQRDAARELEHENTRKVLHRAEQIDRRAIGTRPEL